MAEWKGVSLVFLCLLCGALAKKSHPKQSNVTVPRHVPDTDHAEPCPQLRMPVHYSVGEKAFLMWRHTYNLIQRVNGTHEVTGIIRRVMFSWGRRYQFLKLSQDKWKLVASGHSQPFAIWVKFHILDCHGNTIASVHQLSSMFSLSPVLAVDDAQGNRIGLAKFIRHGLKYSFQVEDVQGKVYVTGKSNTPAFVLRWDMTKHVTSSLLADSRLGGLVVAHAMRRGQDNHRLIIAIFELLLVAIILFVVFVLPPLIRWFNRKRHAGDFDRFTNICDPSGTTTRVCHA